MLFQTASMKKTIDMHAYTRVHRQPTSISKQVDEQPSKLATTKNISM
jgi:hypothetical protein